jgi:hypothetical protein
MRCAVSCGHFLNRSRTLKELCGSISTRIITYLLLLFIAEKNGVGATVVDMKTPAARKQASRRITASSGQKPTPLRGE